MCSEESYIATNDSLYKQFINESDFSAGESPQSAHSVRSARACPIVVRRAKLATQSSASIFIMVAQLRAVTSSRRSVPMCSNSFPPRRPSGLHT